MKTLPPTIGLSMLERRLAPASHRPAESQRTRVPETSRKRWVRPGNTAHRTGGRVRLHTRLSSAHPALDFPIDPYRGPVACGGVVIAG